MEKVKIKSLFISDVHLGSKKSHASKLVDVLKHYKFDNLFILGDFMDLIALKNKFYWKQSHSNVVQKILKLSKKDCKVVYILGNHDAYIRHLLDGGMVNLGDIHICDDYIYNGIKGDIYLCHGDKWDGFIQMNPWLYSIGDWFYELSMEINKVINFFRRIFRMEYWSLSAYLKKKVKNAVKFLNDFENLVIKECKVKDVKKVMIGHIHNPKIDTIDGLTYYNTGDFCESCSFIVEELNGDIKLKFHKEL